MALLSVLTGCVSTPATGTAAVDACSARIAVFGPLSGDSANLGRNVGEGVRLAVDQYNRGRPHCQVRVVDFDSQGDPKRAPALAQQVVADQRILGVVGPAFSGESEAANPLLDQGSVATISASATAASLSERGWGTFHRVLGSDDTQGPAAGRYIDTVLAGRKVFVIDDAGAYGQGLASRVIEVLGDRVVQSITMPPGSADIRDVVTQIQAAAPDTIFYGGYYGEAGRLLRQARAVGVTATFVAGDGVKDDGFVAEAGLSAAQGAVITCPCRPPETVGGSFTRDYHDKFGRPPGTFSAEGYDAATVFLRGIEADRLSRRAMVRFVSAYEGPGLTTTVRFTPSGELVDSSVTVWAYQVRGRALVADQPIP
ncbi:branched-chain amino acid ABC transporter substrate-binding protein [Micromonospora sp. LOL_024]|uniref:branched-chain amino acid ABC transporter substrate-binding protein n=1 Tax=Micromonospora sp. LOL_024 TaxID=3345412 RepID=UPI003A84D16A